MSPGLRATRGLARILLRCYPRAFQRRHREAFIDGATHRWERELEARGGESRATLATGLLLCADTLGAAPSTWRSGGGRRTPPDPHHGRERRLMSWLHGVASDLRLALRLMRRQPATAALAVMTLALGIGVSTAAFGALDRVALRPLPFENGPRMRYLALLDASLGWQMAPETPLINRWRQGSRLVDRIEIHRNSSVVRLGDGPAARLSVTNISVGLPGMLGVRPLLGRMLTEGDTAPDTPPVVMVTEGFWKRELGRRADIVGLTLRLTSGPATVVGVWPASAAFNYQGMPDLIRMMSREEEADDAGWTLVMATLKPGASDTEVRDELDALAGGSDSVPDGMKATVVPATGFVSAGYLTGVWLVFAGGLVLFSVAVISAANLLLGRAMVRDGELGIRLALGGSHGRIVRLFAAESAMLTAAGAAAGVGVAALTAAAYAMWDPRGIVDERGGWLDGRTLAFAGAAATVAMLVATVVPAWRARSTNIRGVVDRLGSARTIAASSRLRGVLVGAQAALAVLLAAGAALTGRSFDAIASVDPGFDVDRLAVVSVSAPASSYPTQEAQAAFIEEIRAALGTLPEVEALTVTNAPPFRTSSGSGVPVFEGEPPPATPTTMEVATQRIDEHYFEVFGTAFVAGRDFVPADGDDAVIINESFARAHGGASVLGRRMGFGASDDLPYVVVGIVEDVTSSSLASGRVARPQLYFPDQSPTRPYARFIARTSGDPGSVVMAARARVRGIDPNVPLSEATTVRDLFRRETAQHRFVAYLLGGLAVFGVIFAVAGVYGVVALDVARRTREVGLRVALGATTGQVVGRVVRRGLRPVLVGALVGVVAALWAGPLLESVLYGVPARDPVSAAAGVLLVVAAAAAGCLLPARRAARIDPAITLRAE